MDQAHRELMPAQLSNLAELYYTLQKLESVFDNAKVLINQHLERALILLERQIRAEGGEIDEDGNVRAAR